MKLFSFIEKTFKSLLPSPFTIALSLTFITFVLAWVFTDSETTGWARGLELVGFWEQGLWQTKLLAFAVQMMLMLVLGHVLALTKPVDRFIGYVTQYCNTTANAALLVTLLTVCMSLFNWGLGLIFGAILARKVGEHAAKRGLKLNYALIGAAGYSGLMVWHGGISGTAPIMASEDKHISTMMEGVVNSDQMGSIPSSVSMSETIFGSMNITVMIALIILLPLFMYWMGKRSKKTTALPQVQEEVETNEEIAEGAEKLDKSRIFALFFGLSFLSYAMYLAVDGYVNKGLGFISPNFINLLLLGLGFTMHQSVSSFLKAVDKAIGGTSGILIQFPLYFGIMGIMKHSGMVHGMSNFFVEISNEVTFPIYTFFSAGIVNVFVPSGGGQWTVQGPIIIKAAADLGVSIPKAIMALSYGDQLTNMLQPFWALPLLGITGLKAKAILPYTVALMGVGILIFVSFLLLF
ncbi:MAG: TIGR00366 family protein [Crocinitomicaceae bacterium]|nr:TIGR00366 family protein [Crocinitomicaceae bacterium]